MTGTGLVYGSLWDNGERGGCQDFIRPLKRAQQMPWHVRSTDAWPHARRRPLSLSLSLSLSVCRRPRLASFPPVQMCISSARTPRLERSRKRYRSSDPAVATLSRDVFIRAERTRSRGIPPSLPAWALYRWTRAAAVETTDGRLRISKPKSLGGQKLERPLRIGEEISYLEEKFEFVIRVFRNHAYRGGRFARFN